MIYSSSDNAKYFFKQITLNQVERHTSTSSCWMIINNKVYDITQFLDEHPGGEDILLESSGRDATREFEDVGHSDEARAQLDELVIGDFREPTEEELEKAKAAAEQNMEAVKPESSGTSFLTSIAKWLVPIVIVGVALVLRKYSGK